MNLETMWTRANGDLGDDRICTGIKHRHVVGLVVGDAGTLAIRFAAASTSFVKVTMSARPARAAEPMSRSRLYWPHPDGMGEHCRGRANAFLRFTCSTTHERIFVESDSGE